MSLEELRAKAEAEEEATQEAEEPETQDEPEEAEAEAEAEAEPEEGSSDEEEGSEAEEAEPSEDFELELDGEPEPGQQKPSPEDALVYKLTKQKQKTREYKTELEELKEELKALKEGRQPQPQSQPTRHEYPPVPLLYENGIDTPEQYQKAYQKWVADCKAIDQRHAEANQQQSEYKRQMEEMTHNLAKRLGKFATEHKIKDDRVVQAAERATSEIDGATKIEGSLAYLLDSVGDGGERVAYYIGTNETAMSKVKELLQADSTGLKAVSYMTKLAGQLKPKHSSRTSKAPAPDRPIKGDGSSASAKALQGKYDKATDPHELMKLRKKARELGVKLT